MILNDISDLKLRQELMLRSARLDSVTDLAGGVAHNFNNLLQIIMGRADFALNCIERGNLSEVKLCLEEIVDRSNFGAGVVRSLRHFTNMKKEISNERGSVVNLSQVMSNAIERAEPFLKTHARKEGAQVSIETELDADCHLKGQANELEDMSLALIRNAVQAISPSSKGKIRVSTSSTGSKSVLKVQDNGIGIPNDHLKKIFDPFWSSKGPSYTGIGLTSVLGIASKHGGEISVESAIGKGSTFTVSFPKSEAGSGNDRSLKSAEPLNTPLSALAVDDEPMVAEMIGDMLMQMGHSATHVSSPEEALNVFIQNPAEIIVSDLGMPGMNGWELLRNIRKICVDKGLEKPYFVLLTGWEGQDLESGKIEESGVDEILVKPVGVQKLMEALTSANIKRRHRESFFRSSS